MAGVKQTTLDFRSLLEQAERNQKISENLLSQRKDPSKLSARYEQPPRRRNLKSIQDHIKCKERVAKPPDSQMARNEANAVKIAKNTGQITKSTKNLKSDKPVTNECKRIEKRPPKSYSDLMLLAKTNIAPSKLPADKQNKQANKAKPQLQVQSKKQPNVPVKSVAAKNIPAARPVVRCPPKVKQQCTLSRRPTARPYDEEEDEDDDMDDFIVDDDEFEEDPNKISATIRSLFKYNRNRRIECDDDDDCMESSYNDIIKEEKRSARIGMLEDLEDMMREEKERQRKKKKI